MFEPQDIVYMIEDFGVPATLVSTSDTVKVLLDRPTQDELRGIGTPIHGNIIKLTLRSDMWATCVIGSAIIVESTTYNVRAIQKPVDGALKILFVANP